MSVNRTGIPYLTHVWNPVVGCNRGCPHCWARQVCSTRIGPNIGCDLCTEFTKHVHRDRYHVPGGKPKVIGLGFMTDLFGVGLYRDDDEDGPRWRPATWPKRWCAEQIRKHPEHTFVTATQCPEGIPEGFEPPDNWWLLCTATTQEEINTRLPEALARWRRGRVVLNLEPLVEYPNLGYALRGWCPYCGYDEPLDEWRCGSCGKFYREMPMAPIEDGPYHRPDVAGVIVGGMSGPHHAEHPFQKYWARYIRDACFRAGVPFYFKQGSGYRPEETPELDGRRHTDLPWEADIDN